MAEKTKHTINDTTLEFEDHELRSTMQEYLQEENKDDTNFWNFATLSGLAMVFVAMSMIIQMLLSNTFGISVGPNLEGVITLLPIIGGVLLVIAGLGWIAGEKREKKEVKFTSGYRSESAAEDRSGETEFSTSSSDYSGGKDRLDEFLYGDKKGRKSKGKSGRMDSYALKQKKKLFKSRTDKKLAGVCGGLAKYFGVNSTMVRLIFAIAALLGYGSFIIVYIAMMIIVPKEPVELMDDFSYLED